jgi:hypothetical protein
LRAQTRNPDGLKHLFEKRPAHLVKGQSQDDGQGECGDHSVYAEGKGVSHGVHKLKGVKKLGEVGVPGLSPGASQYPCGIAVILEGDEYAVHGLVGKKYKQNASRKKEQIKTAVLADIVPGYPITVHAASSWFTDKPIVSEAKAVVKKKMIN